MAIRDFGTSLLANVRARKDAGQAEARKYERSQKNKDTRTAFLAPFVSAGLGAIGSAINAGTAQKTQDFLANSELYSNKLKVQKAGTLIEKAQGYREAAKEANTSIYDQFLQSTANTAAAQHQIAKPNAIKDGEVEEYASVLMERDEIKALAKDKTAYWESILDKADAYSKGKSKTTLESLAAIQQPKSVVGSMWNKITGNENTVDLFNSQMSRLEQVVAATEIDTLALERKKKMAQTLLKNGGDLSVAKLMVGQELTKEEQVRYKARLKAGEKSEELQQDIQVSSRGVYVTTYEKVTEQGGNIRIDQSVVQKFGPDHVLDSSDIVALTGSLESLMDSVAGRFNEKGRQDFALKVQEVVNSKPKNKKLNTTDVLKLYTLSLTPDEFTERKNITTALDPQVQAALIERTEGMTKTMSEELQTIIDSSDPQDKEKTAELLNLFNSFISQTVESIRNPENMTDVDERNKARIEDLKASNPNLSTERAIEYLKNKGTWNE
jgi:hypothetical protein